MLKITKVLFLASLIMLLNTSVNASSASDNSYMNRFMNNKLIVGALGISLAATCYFGNLWKKSNQKVSKLEEEDATTNERVRKKFQSLSDDVKTRKDINLESWTTNNKDLEEFELSKDAFNGDGRFFSCGLFVGQYAYSCKDAFTHGFQDALTTYNNKKNDKTINNLQSHLKVLCGKTASYSTKAQKEKHQNFKFGFATGTSALVATSVLYSLFQK